MELTEARRQRMSSPRTWASAAHLAASWSLYVLLAMLALRIPWFARIPAWFAMAWLLLGNGAIVHEAAHRHLFRSAGANRLTGAVAGAAVLLPWGVYRPYHLSHHRYTVAIEDPGTTFDRGGNPSIPPHMLRKRYRVEAKENSLVVETEKPPRP